MLFLLFSLLFFDKLRRGNKFKRWVKVVREGVSLPEGLLGEEPHWKLLFSEELIFSQRPSPKENVLFQSRKGSCHACSKE